MYGTNFEKHCAYLIQYFDEQNADDEYADFLSEMRQSNNESVRISRQRFDERQQI